MNTKDKTKFNEALKLFDNKEYRNSKKACEKILEKQPTNADAMALKGLVMAFLNEKEEGAKIINAAIKLNFSNPNSWHFYALYNKEIKNYAQAIKCYLQAYKNDPSNFNILRDLSYLQLYLRQFNAFNETARKAVELRPNMLLNWTTYSFANYLIGNYEYSYKLLDSCIKVGGNTIKDQEKHEILIFQVRLLIKQNKLQEALDFIIENEKNLMDSSKVNENIISLAIKLDKKEMGLEYIKKSLSSNAENLLIFISYFNLTCNSNLKTFDDLINIDLLSKRNLYKLIENDLKKQHPKSRLLIRLELLFSESLEFKSKFNDYFIQYVKQNIPSIFINIKFIYKHQHEKIPIIEEVISSHILSIEKENKLSSDQTAENLSLTPHFIWVYYYAASHYDHLRDTEKALVYINKAIDSTPTVVDFYILKSKIFKHAGMLSESALAYEKAKKLDLGDRYLNAKYAKTLVRNNEIEKSIETMKEFIRDPISDENIEHTQCMWYETECGFNYLQNGSLLKAHRLFKMIFNHFNTLIEDQFDFYNYCLRRFMVNDFANTIEYMDRILDNKYVYISLEAFEVILRYIKSEKNIQKKLEEEYKEMNFEKYKFIDANSLKTEIENDLYNFSLKLQNYSRSVSLHYLCVKSFLNKGKIILALKSMMFLKNNANQGYEYYDSLFKFKEYISKNQNYIDIIYENISELKEEVKDNYKNNMDILKNIYLIENQNELESIFNFDEKSLKKIKSSFFIKLKIYLKLFCSEDYKKEFLEKLNKIIKIESDEKSIMENMSFYQDRFNS